MSVAPGPASSHPAPRGHILLLTSHRSRPIPQRPQSHVWLPVALLLSALACGGDGTGPVGPPASITVAAGADQQGTVGRAVAIAPGVRVRDASGRGVPGLSVKFDILQGGGVVTLDSVVTDGQGLATVGEWRLGPLPSTNILRAQVLNHPLSVQINATAGPGAPATIQIVTGGANLSAVVEQEVTPRPAVRVRDSFGNPIPDTEVTWLVTSGGGSLTGPSITRTDAEGRTTVTGWRLGPVSGTNQLQARTTTSIVATFNAIGVGIPEAITATSPTDQAGYLDFAVPKVPRVRVTDSFGADIQGVPVVFTMVAGNGSILGDTVITDAEGVAALADWKLGSEPFSQVDATVPGYDGPPTSFTVSGVERAFTIDIRFLNTPDADLRDGYVAGAMRWMEVIVGDLPDFIANLPTPWSCVNVTLPATTGTIDDLVIYARIGPGDGPGGVLARAGPCSVGERGGSRLTAIGYMEFDQADALNLTPDQFRHVVIHEMGHVLGLLEPRWTFHNLMVNGADPYYTGAGGLAGWPLLGISYAGNPVPIENTGGSGTAGSHWRESVMVEEIMTGWIEPAGIHMPLTAVTVGAIADLGYVVDPAQAEPFVPAIRDFAIPLGTKLKLNEEIFEAPWIIGGDGKLRPLP